MALKVGCACGSILRILARSHTSPRLPCTNPLGINRLATNLLLSPLRRCDPSQSKRSNGRAKATLARLSGVEDRTAAEALKGSEIRMPTAQFPQADDGDFYWRDLEGLHVWCEEGESRLLLGTVQRLLETGANDVLVVTPSDGSIDDRERLIPWLPDEVIKQVDLQERTIAVSWFIDA